MNPEPCMPRFNSPLQKPLLSHCFYALGGKLCRSFPVSQAFGKDVSLESVRKSGIWDAAWSCQPLPWQHSRSRSWARALWEPSSAPLMPKAVQTPLGTTPGNYPWQYLSAATSVRHFLSDNVMLLIKKKRRAAILYWQTDKTDGKQCFKIMQSAEIIDFLLIPFLRKWTLCIFS